MFIPNSFRFEDRDEKIAFMRRYSFATIITAKDNVPLATQLPFAIDDRSGHLILSSHFAAGNEQARYVEENRSLVIFSEPHAYISPAHYDRKESVPTWDYIAVHAYGKAKIVEDEEGKVKILEEMIKTYEPAYSAQWNGLSDKFRKGMMNGIVAFELEVADLHGKKKLSQNKTEEERERIIKHLEKSENTAEKEIAAYIKKL